MEVLTSDLLFCVGVQMERDCESSSNCILLGEVGLEGRNKSGRFVAVDLLSVLGSLCSCANKRAPAGTAGKMGACRERAGRKRGVR